MGKVNNVVKEDENLRRRHHSLDRKRAAVLGIDPGITGGMAVYDLSKNKLICAQDLPVIKVIKNRKSRTEIDARRFATSVAEAICEYNVLAIAIEKVSASSQMGVTSAFSFGGSYHALKSICEVLHPEVILIPPSVWKPALNVPSDKKLAIERARAIFGKSPWLDRDSKDGVAEAALIALYAAKYKVEYELDPLS